VSAVASFAGAKLANDIYTPDNVGGQIGGMVGSQAGSIAAGILLKAAFASANPVAAVALVAAAVIVKALFTVIGGLIGSLFGGTPRSGADASWDAAQGKYVVANAWTRKNGSIDAAKSLAGVVADTFNGVLEATGGTLLNPERVQSGSYGMRKKDFTYRPVGGGSDKGNITQTFSGKEAATQLIGYGIYTGLTDPDFRIAGGNIYVKRALYNGLAQGQFDPRNFDTNTLLGNISSAQSYEKYLQNATAIGALVAAEPDSVFAAETLLTLARAVDVAANDDIDFRLSIAS
jgi:hypothetical protein